MQLFLTWIGSLQRDCIASLPDTNCARDDFEYGWNCVCTNETALNDVNGCITSSCSSSDQNCALPHAFIRREVLVRTDGLQPSSQILPSCVRTKAVQSPPSQRKRPSRQPQVGRSSAAGSALRTAAAPLMDLWEMPEERVLVMGMVTDGQATAPGALSRATGMAGW